MCIIQCLKKFSIFWFVFMNLRYHQPKMSSIMNNYHFIRLLLVILILVKIQIITADFLKCTPAYCTTHPCNEIKCKGPNKILLHNVTTCGCCHRCITELEQDSDCILEMKGNVPDTECGPHLRCDKDVQSPSSAICKKISDIEEYGCEYEHKQIQGDQFKMIASIQPQCDELGQYQLKQCKNGTLCQCVKPYTVVINGKEQTKIRPIFGTDIYTNADKMNCLCSYQYEKINEQLREMTHSLQENHRYRRLLEMNWQQWGWSFSGPNGGTGNGFYDIDPAFYVRCKPNGNYYPFQIYGSYMYCVDEKTGQLIDRPVQIQHAKNLPCYSHRYSFRDENGCIMEYNRTVQQYYRLKKEQSLSMIISFDFPNCDLDGSYAPVQCQNDRCFCVNRNGEEYVHMDTSISRHDEYFGKSQQCTCVRNQEHIRDIKHRDKITDLFAKYQCDKNGNYLPLQCSNTQCYCVDSITGFAEQEPVMKTERDLIESLPCYQNYPDKKYLAKQLQL